jgi:ATP-dependent Lhr-like helicase
VVLAATDPAQPYGSTLAWPRDESETRKPYQRVPGARVVLIDGLPIFYLDRSHRGLLSFSVGNDDVQLLALHALGADPAALDGRGLSIERVDGVPAMESPLGSVLRDAGFAQGYRGFTMRPEHAQRMAHA